MKKSITLLFVCMLSVAAMAESHWSIGVQLALAGIPSKFSGGMQEAHALFTHPGYGFGQLGIYGRYRINDRLSLQTGFDFSQIGFQYALSKNYSLLRPAEHYAVLKTGTGMTRIPAILIYNSKLNCRNIRFIAGAGLALDAIDNKWKSESTSEITNENLNSTATTYMTSSTRSIKGSTVSFTWLIGTEKVFKRGNMLSFTFQANHGFGALAESTVQYTADNKNYTHTFTNRGGYGAFAITYYFAPVGSRKSNHQSLPVSK